MAASDSALLAKFFTLTQGKKQRAKHKGKPVPKVRAGIRIGEKFSSFVVDKSKTVTVVTSIILLLLAGFVFQINYTYDTMSSYPDDMLSKEGFALIEDAFIPGQLAPVKLIVDTQGNDADLKVKLADLSYIGKVSEL